MLVIGLTGSSGSGKSTVSQMLQEQGFDVINCDSIARDVVRIGSPCLNAIIETFGETVRGIAVYWQILSFTTKRNLKN